MVSVFNVSGNGYRLLAALDYNCKIVFTLRFAVVEDMHIHHPGSNHGDDDRVSADDAAPGGFGEGELVRDR